MHDLATAMQQPCDMREPRTAENLDCIRAGRNASHHLTRLTVGQIQRLEYFEAGDHDIFGFQILSRDGERDLQKARTGEDDLFADLMVGQIRIANGIDWGMPFQPLAGVTSAGEEMPVGFDADGFRCWRVAELGLLPWVMRERDCWSRILAKDGAEINLSAAYYRLGERLIERIDRLVVAVEHRHRGKTGGFALQGIG